MGGVLLGRQVHGDDRFRAPGLGDRPARACGTGTGHVCSTLADSAAAVPTGQYGGLAATADSANGNATTWSIVLRTIEPNQAPTAAFTLTCDSAACEFDGTDSSDADGNVVSYAWDFGDGGTATGATPSHDFVTSGTRDVTLTVTDDEGTDRFRRDPGLGGPHQREPDRLVHHELRRSSSAASTRAPRATVTARWTPTRGTSATEIPTPRRPTSSHTYEAAGPYVVTVTVTDNDGGTGSTTRNVAPVAVRPIALRGQQRQPGQRRRRRTPWSPRAPLPATGC